MWVQAEVASWICKLKLQAEVASCWLQCPLKTIILIEDLSMPIQVKFAVQEGYNHDSIVISLIAKETNWNVDRKAKKWNESETIQNYHVLQQQQCAAGMLVFHGY